METQIKATNLSLTEETRSYLRKKLEALEKLLPPETPSRAEVELALTTRHHQTGDIFRAEINLRAAGTFYRAEVDDATLHAAIDKAEAKVVEEIRRYKHKDRSFTRRAGAYLKERMRQFTNWRF